MTCFKVTVNDTKPIVAGLSDTNDKVLTCIIDSREDAQGNRVHLHLGGLDGQSSIHYIWGDHRIDIGDEIKVSVIETDQVSEPISTKVDIENDDVIQSKLKAYYRLKEELKDYIE